MLVSMNSGVWFNQYGVHRGNRKIIGFQLSNILVTHIVSKLLDIHTQATSIPRAVFPGLLGLSPVERRAALKATPTTGPVSW